MLAGALAKKLKKVGPISSNENISGKRKPNGVSAETSNPKKKFKAKYAYKKPLTTEEVNQLLESSNSLTNENLFGLQINEILKATKIPAKHESFIQDWVRDLNEFIKSIKSDTEKTSSNELKWTNKIRIPIDESNLDIPEFQFQFLAPISALVIGAHAVSTTIGPSFTVDVAIDIPGEFFRKDNYLNQIYHKKKALYLAYLTLQLQTWTRTGDYQFAFQKNDRYYPIIVVKPTGIRNLRFHIHTCCETKALKLNRFLPSTSNVRPSMFREAGQTEELQATPHYNTSVLRDLTLIQNENFLTRMLEMSQTNIRDALVLFKLWLRTRGIERSAFGGHLISMYAVHLMKLRKINAAMSTFDVLRILWIQLATSRWNEVGKGISLHPEPSTSFETFHHHFDVVFLDVTGYLNLAANLSLDVYLRLRDESSKALSFLAVATLSNFRHLFTNARPTYLQYDHIINIPAEANLKQLICQEKYISQFHDYCGQVKPIAVDVIANILRQGFGKRISSMTPIYDETICWNVNEEPTTASSSLSFGLILNPEYALEVLDKGPQGDQEQEVEEFQRFWGSKSNLRRFQDGSMVEACVWTTPNASLCERRLICKSITLHLLDHHLGIQGAHISYLADQFDVAYQTKTYDDEEKTNTELLSLNVIKSLDDLSKRLRSLADIPLDISSVQGTSPVFRYCGVQPVTPVATNELITDAIVFNSYIVNELVIQLAASGKWPDNLTALQRLKAAFSLKIAKELREQGELAAKSNGHVIDVQKDGFIFRIHIAVQKELTLMKKTINSNGVIIYRDTEISRAYERSMLIVPRLTVFLHTLYHQHTSFGPAVMIAKRWLNAQLIDSYLWPEECTELLMARVYLQTGSLVAPVQPQVGFFRWLQLLATTDWKTEMVLLNFYNGLNDEQVAKLESNFTKDRESFPFLTIISSGGESKEWTLWSREAPSLEITARVAVLSRTLLTLVEQGVFNEIGLLIPSIFAPTLEGYDVLIKLRRNHIPETLLKEIQQSTAKPERYVNSRPLTAAKIPQAGLNFVQLYLKELRAAYDDFALFFHDSMGGDTIAVLWKPNALVPKDFKTTAALGGKIDNNMQCVCNIVQMVEDFRLIGHGLVEKVTDVTQRGN